MNEEYILSAIVVCIIFILFYSFLTINRLTCKLKRQYTRLIGSKRGGFIAKFTPTPPATTKQIATQQAQLWSNMVRRYENPYNPIDEAGMLTDG